MKIIVQKFGGTSVATPDKRELVLQKIVKAKEAGYAPVVVVSAIGRKGDPYATDTLLDLVPEIKEQDYSREKDLLMACGEIISGTILTNLLTKAGFAAEFLTGWQAGVITDNNFNDARILRVEPQRIYGLLQAGKIVVVAGFQGISETGDITTLGRGGSDTTASALGVALEADYIDIYTDVEGIMTADPRIVSNAKILDVVTYNEICQLANEGAKVIHPRAVEIAQQKHIPLRIMSTFTDGPGTLVTSRNHMLETTGIHNDRLITGITHIPNVTQITVDLATYTASVNPVALIFNTMASAKISVDFINVLPDRVVYTVKDHLAERAKQLLESFGFAVLLKPNCSKVATVGAAMTGIPGVMAAIVSALANEQIPILQSADSYTTIWVLVEGEYTEKAVLALHDQFKLGILQE